MSNSLRGLWQNGAITIITVPVIDICIVVAIIIIIIIIISINLSCIESVLFPSILSTFIEDLLCYSRPDLPL